MTQLKGDTKKINIISNNNNLAIHWTISGSNKIKDKGEERDVHGANYQHPLKKRVPLDTHVL